MSVAKWVVVSFVLFAAFIATLVTVCVRQDVSLVSQNYYQEELQFQSQIDRKHNTTLLANKPLVAVEGKMLTLALNQEATVTEGTVQVFCPSNARMDRSFRVSPQSPTQSFDLNELDGGMYRVKLRWTMNDKQYYQEQIIHL